MLILKRVRQFGLVTVLATIPLVPLAAQTPYSAPPGASPPPGPGMQLPKAAPTTRPADPVQNPLIGLAVFSSDGNKVGTVDSVDGEPDGKITAINIKVGGFLGFGTKVVVVIPEGKFRRAGAIVQIGMTAEDISKLPAVKDQT
jgi:sporulation protein YlmC with PRC-barrel domain